MLGSQDVWSWMGSSLGMTLGACSTGVGQEQAVKPLCPYGSSQFQRAVDFRKQSNRYVGIVSNPKPPESVGKQWRRCQTSSVAWFAGSHGLLALTVADARCLLLGSRSTFGPRGPQKSCALSIEPCNQNVLQSANAKNSAALSIALIGSYAGTSHQRNALFHLFPKSRDASNPQSPCSFDMEQCKAMHRLHRPLVPCRTDPSPCESHLLPLILSQICPSTFDSCFPASFAHFFTSHELSSSNTGLLFSLYPRTEPALD